MPHNNRWAVEAGRTITLHGAPIVSLDKADGVAPVVADGLAHFVVECLNRADVTLDELYRRQMGHAPRPRTREETRPRGARRGRAPRESGERKFSMSYGELPSFRQFDRDIRTRIDPDSGRPYLPAGTDYPMELVEHSEIELAQRFNELEPFNTSRPGYAFGFRGDGAAIYSFLTFLVEELNSGNDAAGDLASSIMYTLGYEWI